MGKENHMIELDKRKINLTGVKNARELGGIPVSGKRIVKKGLLIRCGRLSDMTREDARILDEEYHVTEIIDLRNSQETIEHPDRPIGQAAWEGIPLLPDLMAGISREDRSERSDHKLDGKADQRKPDAVDQSIWLVRRWEGQAVENMKKLYLIMAASDYTTAKMKEFLQAWIQHKDGAFLWHCTAGKDRTGITAALILWILGAAREDIEAEYQDTAMLIAGHLKEFEQEVYRRTGDIELTKACTMTETVHPSYIKAYLDTLAEKYGSVDAYLQERIGITTAEREAMRKKYTEPV